MTTLDTLRMLTRYARWADERMFDALAALPGGEATKKRETLFGNMVHTMNHSYVIDRIWQAHLEGRPHGYTARNTKDHPALETLRAAQLELDAWYIAYADTLTPEKAAEKVRFPFIDGGEGEMARGDMLLHIVNHKTYHRGFVADMFYQVPARPPVTDLPVFLCNRPG